MPELPGSLGYQSVADMANDKNISCGISSLQPITGLWRLPAILGAGLAVITQWLFTYMNSGNVEQVATHLIHTRQHVANTCGYCRLLRGSSRRRLGGKLMRITTHWNLLTTETPFHTIFGFHGHLHVDKTLHIIAQQSIVCLYVLWPSKDSRVAQAV
jgi:hypothetical protein